MKRQLLRRLSSWSGGDTHTRHGSGSLTRQPPPSPLSAASASTLRFALLCALWYTTSALSSNTGKAILTQFRFPITLTFVQFGFVAGYCLLFMSPAVRFARFKTPTRAVFSSTLPMGCFQVGGHIFSSMAISRIPVSTVHTIKALSPLFTVAAYALLFRVRYSAKTYVSLLPLTIGVMLACSFDMSASNAIGLLCAFGSALVFVSSNIFFKKIMPSGPNAAAASSHKLDKLNLLFYSSSMAFVLMIPIWLYYDLPALLVMLHDPAHIGHPAQGHAHSHHSVAWDFLANGTVHFAQNIIAFILLAQTSPVTYSIASLIKRVAVICIAIVWFAQPVHPVQACGITLTFAGLYMYNQAKSDVELGERSMRRVAAARAMELPSTRAELSPTSTPAPPPDVLPAVGVASGYGRPRGQPAAAAHVTSPNPPLRTLPHHPSTDPRPAQPLSYSHTHHTPNLRIQITPPAPANAKPGTVPTPVDLYPSPPPSLDSPPAEEPAQAWIPASTPRRRGSMATGHAPPRHREQPAPRAAAAA
ncbi:hypothetical protein IEO21_01102 [Rhodonia placenta]|uniref:Sugar phosphate transporter domain-containing protein n=1 Tax=Rhodonia placenta TaxID=104341 RepID=A0A8H7PAA6_9APHY|nr:hypothetical protein IEO21_01102 [Postia placenta]